MSEVLRRKMEEKTEAQLLHILQNEHQFRPNAVKIAREVLEAKRNSSKPIEKEEIEPIQETETQTSKPSRISIRNGLIGLAIFQSLSSVYIVPDFISTLFSFPEMSFLNYLLLLFWVVFHLTVLSSSVLIFFKKNFGIQLALICTILKLFEVEIGSFIYTNTDFLRIIVNIGLTFGIDFDLGTVSNNISILTSSVEYPFIGINLLSVGLLFFLHKAKSQILDGESSLH